MHLYCSASHLRETKEQCSYLLICYETLLKDCLSMLVVQDMQGPRRTCSFFSRAQLLRAECSLKTQGSLFLLGAHSCVNPRSPQQEYRAVLFLGGLLLQALQQCLAVNKQMCLLNLIDAESMPSPQQHQTLALLHWIDGGRKTAMHLTKSESTKQLFLSYCCRARLNECLTACTTGEMESGHRMCRRGQ